MPRRRELPLPPDILEDAIQEGGRRRRLTAEPEDVRHHVGIWAEADDPCDQELLQVLVEAYDGLDDRERFVCDAVIFERLSLQKTADRIGMSKTHTNRIKNAAMRKLAVQLQDHPLVRGRLRHV